MTYRKIFKLVYHINYETKIELFKLEISKKEIILIHVL